MAAAARQFSPEVVAIADAACYGELSAALAGSGVRVLAGPEGVIEAALAQTGATSADLFAVLRDYRGHGADAFLRRFIALEDYEMYCEFMAEWSTLTDWQRKHVDKSAARRAIEMIGRQIQPI